jgi:hypothetical protein
MAAVLNLPTIATTTVATPLPSESENAHQHTDHASDSADAGIENILQTMKRMRRMQDGDAQVLAFQKNMNDEMQTYLDRFRPEHGEEPVSVNEHQIEECSRIPAQLATSDAYATKSSVQEYMLAFQNLITQVQARQENRAEPATFTFTLNPKKGSEPPLDPHSVVG